MTDIAKSPEEDKAEIARSIVKLSLESKDPQEVLNEFNKHPDLKKEFEDDEKAFVEKYLTASSADEAGEGQGSDNASGSGDAGSGDESITLTFDKKLLHTYKDVVEMSKGVVEKNNVIDFFKNKKVPELETGLRSALAENQSLKKQLEEFKKNAQGAPSGASAASNAQNTSADLSEIRDLLNEEEQSKLLNVVKNTVAKVSALEERVVSVDGTVANVKSTVENDRNQRSESLEALEIETLKKSKTDIFKSTRPVGAIETDYKKFLADGARLAGFDGNIFGEDGGFSTGAQTAFRLYHDQTPEGEAFRAKLTAANVVFPEDFSDLKTLNEIKALRQAEAEIDPVSGKHTLISWDDAAAKFAEKLRQAAANANNANIETQKKELEAREKGKENRGKFAKQVPANSGAGDVKPVDKEVLKQRFTAYFQSVKAGKPNPTEREQLYNLLINAGMSKEEANDALK